MRTYAAGARRCVVGGHRVIRRWLRASRNDARRRRGGRRREPGLLGSLRVTQGLHRRPTAMRATGRSQPRHRLSSLPSLSHRSSDQRSNHGSQPCRPRDGTGVIGHCRSGKCVRCLGRTVRVAPAKGPGYRSVLSGTSGAESAGEALVDLVTTRSVVEAEGEATRSRQSASSTGPTGWGGNSCASSNCRDPSGDSRVIVTGYQGFAGHVASPSTRSTSTTIDTASSVCKRPGSYRP